MSYITLPSTGGGISSVNTDGITLTGDGVATDIEILQVQTDATITGDGTVASPLSAVGGGGGSSLNVAYIRHDKAGLTLNAPNLYFVNMNNGDWDLAINTGTIVDITSGAIRFLVDGTYIMRCQMTFILEEQLPTDTVFILTSGLTQTVGAGPPPEISGTIYANIEANSPYTHTVQYEWIVDVKGVTLYYPYVEITGDSCDLVMEAEENSNWTITKVA